MPDVEIRKPTGIVRGLQALGFFKQRNLFWSWYEPRNFGDWIGPYLFQRLTNKPPLYCSRSTQRRAICLFTAGSIMRHIACPGRVTVWGSGIISRADTFKRPLKTLAVRGPRTRERMQELGFDCPAVYGDPAILLPLIFKPVEQRQRIGIIPHFIECDAYRNRFGGQAHVIDVCRPVEDVVKDIASCEITYSSSLHGLIVSHAYGVPSIWMESSVPLKGDDVKFDDYYGSCNASPRRRASLLHLDRSRRDDTYATLPNHDDLRAGLISSLPQGWTLR